MEHYFTRRNYVRTLLVGYVIGSVVVTIANLRSEIDVWRIAVYVLIIGFCINTLIWALEYLFRNMSDRLSFAQQMPLHIALSTFGGAGGYVIGRTLAGLLLTGRLPRLSHFGQPLLITILVSFFAGFGMWFYFQLEERLREKVREQELANQELTLARAIQERLLPPPEFARDGFRITARNLAAQFVAGDFYDMIARPDGSVIAVVADVAGKGVAASLIMASVKSVLPLIASVESVDATMQRLNEKLSRELGRREFVALACAAYDPATRRVTLANAGLPDPYLIRDGTATPLSVPGPRFPLGIRATNRYESLTIDIQPGDRLLLLTDGLPEASIGDDEPLGYERFAQLACHTSIDALFAAVEAESKGPRGDDWTALMLEVTG